MAAIRKIFRRIVFLFTVFIGLILIALAVGTVYYLSTRLHPWDFVLPQAARVITAENGIADPLLPDIYAALPGQFQGIRSLSENLERVKNVHPSLQQILAHLTGRVLLIETQNGRGMLIADMGWQSLLLPGGGLAVRSIFNPEDSMRFSAREVSTSGAAYILYSISPSNEEDAFHLALLGNILLIAEDAAAITASVQASHAPGQQHDVPWKDLADAFSGERLCFLYAPEHSPIFIHGRTKLDVTERGSALILRFDAQKTARISIRSFFDAATGDGHGASRMLRSNQYQANRLRALPEGLESYTALLFDDIQELIQLAGNIGTERFDLSEMEAARIHDWAANEIAFISWDGHDFVSLKAQNAGRALDALGKISAQGFVLEDNNEYMLLHARLPGFMRVFTPWMGKTMLAEYCVKQNTVFTFSDTPETLKSLIGAPKDKALPEEALSLASEKANILLFTKGAGSFFPAGMRIAQAAGLAENKLYACARIKLSKGEIQSEILFGEFPDR
jgi:hypothetical protein